jgi:hypothetical protein
MIQILLEAGADLTVKDSFGHEFSNLEGQNGFHYFGN